MISRLARWWLARSERRARKPTPRFDECPGCGGPSSHRVIATFNDAVESEMGAGGTYMSADFCPDHCPGGCVLNCPPRPTRPDPGIPERAPR